jgi:hypothetical protein
MSSFNDAIEQGQRRYRMARSRLNSRLPASVRESAFDRVRDCLEEFGLTETTQRLRNTPEQFGLPACRELLETRDALDQAIAQSPHRDGPGGRLMAFDGELARVSGDGEIREIDEPEREQDHDNEDWDQDREP